jgi:hypothetical protein
VIAPRAALAPLPVAGPPPSASIAAVATLGIAIQPAGGVAIAAFGGMNGGVTPGGTGTPLPAPGAASDDPHAASATSISRS